MSFAPVKTKNAAELKTAVKQIIANVYADFKYMMQSEMFEEGDRKAFAAVNKEMDDVTAYTAVNSLCMYLSKYYGKDAIVLLDEYDTPMQEAWLSESWDETVGFFRSFFHYTFKTNPHLYRGLITGITRISRESIFSDLNNLKVVTTTSDQYADAFGFTFGRHADIYNPWSIASFVESGGKYDAYWANTSGNNLVNSLIQKGSPGIKQTMEGLLQGKNFTAEIDEQIVFERLSNSINAVWSLLLAAGYLKVEQLAYIGTRKRAVYTLALTNMEVAIMFENMVKGWFQDNSEIPYNDFVKALLMHDMDAMNEFMNEIAFYSISHFDVAKSASSKDSPKRFYHGFVLGLIVELAGRFQITSNRESGFGRYDIMLVPMDAEQDDAYIIEFKVHKPNREKDLEETAANALAQIEAREYAAQLMLQGISAERIKKYGFAFRGKHCLIRSGPDPVL